MKSKTSFSNLTTFKKDITRFAPLWVLYLIGMMLVMLEVLDQAFYDRVGDTIPGIIRSFGIVNLIYAGLIASIQFGDLYNTRMCYSLHTMPQRRESWFVSHLGAGLCFSLVPNLLMMAIMLLKLQDYWFLGLYWLLAVTIQFVFFYGLAAVSALLTGHRFAMLLVYVGLNFVSMLAYWGVNTIYLPMITGVILDMSPFRTLCPVVQMFDFEYFEFESKQIAFENENLILDTRTFFEYKGFGDGWGYLAVLAVVGVVALGLALLLYRLRHLESAGDFIAFPKLKGAACVIMTLCVAGVFAFVGEEMIGDGYLLWMIVGVVIGFFGSLMLLERRIKVFRGKNLIGFAALAAVLVVSSLAVSMDVFNIEEYLPRAEKVESVTITNYRISDYNFNLDELNYGNRNSIQLTETEDIAQIITAHQDILERLDEDISNKDTHRISFVYKLKNGRTVIRTYVAPASGTNYEIVSKYFYTPQFIMGYTDWVTYVENVTYIGMEGIEIPQEMYRPLLEALKADCEKGYVLSRGSDKTEKYLDLQIEYENGSTGYRMLYVLSGAENTLALLKTPEMQLGYTDPTIPAKGMQYMAINGAEVPEKDRLALLEALLKDCKEGTLEAGYNETADYEIVFEYINENYVWCYRYLRVNEKAENTYNWVLEQKENLN